MKQYESTSGIRVYASSPDDASVEFCKEAEKAGIFLYEAKKFNPNKAVFENPVKCFAKDKNAAVLAAGDYILILPANKHNMTGLTGGDYGVLSPDIFNILYKLIDSTQEKPAQSNRLAEKSFYLDAGHGGKDSGAVNDNLGLQEKIAALDVCLKLGELLEAQGAKIYYSRTDNASYPALATRASEANAKNVTAFISIHLNGADNKSASGIETLVYSLKGTAAELAEKVQRNMVAATGWKDRGVKERPGLTVLKKTKMPAILCEIGFISNDEQARQLFMTETQDKIARAIADGIIEQFGN